MQSLFFSTQADRVALARQRYFEEGELPSGVVSEAVFQSWTRCLRQKQDPRGQLEFQPVSASRAQLALQKNRLLRDAWLAEASELDAVLGATNCGAMLTDPSGVLIGATCSRRVHEKITPVAHRIGVNFAEEVVGTTAPGIVARTGKQACVQGAEHFFESVNFMHCAAAPIRDIHGNLAGVLDMSSEGIAFNFDAASVVGLYASSIANRLLVSQSSEHLIVRFQISPAMLDTPMAGLMGVDMQGRIVWRNAAASRLLGIAPDGEQSGLSKVDEILQSSFSELASSRGGAHSLLRLPNGLQVHVRCELQARDGHRQLLAVGKPSQETPMVDISPVVALPIASAPVADAAPPAVESPEPASLRDADADLIAKTLKECGGNVSAAARKLRVSRGLIYRRIQSA
ncbi:helix-turn-helix domain-containing protein [Rhodoferax ferrireducens]|uniref:helix-turn-helix domain-containing protein n=1 Tax=Rhodoferax ferrireducens TaxID=192843 RepID=UPI00130084C5|nr:helix-turn-helix domain-containing protein [Rhodoferax ferrireducens]